MIKFIAIYCYSTINQVSEGRNILVEIFTMQNMEKDFRKTKCTRVRSGMLILKLLNFCTGTSVSHSQARSFWFLNKKQLFIMFMFPWVYLADSPKFWRLYLLHFCYFVFMDKREHLWNIEKCILFHFESSSHSWDNQILMSWRHQMPKHEIRNTFYWITCNLGGKHSR